MSQRCTRWPHLSSLNPLNRSLCAPANRALTCPQTLEQYSLRKPGSAAGDLLLELPPPQTVAVALVGRVLTRAHVEAGLFIPLGNELAEARAALASAALWVPPTKLPFFDRAAAVTAGTGAAAPAQERSALGEEEDRRDAAEAAAEREEIDLLSSQLEGLLGAGAAAGARQDEEDRQQAARQRQQAELGGLKSRRASPTQVRAAPTTHNASPATNSS